MKNNLFNEYIYINIKNITIPILVKRYSTSRRLKLMGRGSNIRVTTSTSISQNRIQEILKANHERIYGLYIEGLAIEKKLLERRLALDLKVYIEGNLTKVIFGKTRLENKLPCYSDGAIIIDIEESDLNYDNVYRQLDLFFFNLSNKYLPRALDESLEFFNLPKKPSLVVKKLKTQWGNCKKSEYRIVLNSHLMKLPPKLRTYVAFHEVTHLLHANHGKEFYEIIDWAFPDRPELDRELREWSFVLRDNYVEEFAE